jgi:hypothetical protein
VTATKRARARVRAGRGLVMVTMVAGRAIEKVARAKAMTTKRARARAAREMGTAMKRARARVARGMATATRVAGN